MLLSIDEAKIAELLESKSEEYGVDFVQPVINNSWLVQKPNPRYPEVSETVYTAPVLITAETRERLMLVRRQIEESGVPLKSAEELTREIDEMRGRR